MSETGEVLDDDDGFDFDVEFVKLNSRLGTLATQAAQLGGTVPDVKAFLQNFLVPLFNTLVSVIGAQGVQVQQLDMLTNQALQMSERTLAGETLSFLIPALFAFDKYLAAHHPDPNSPIRRQYAYILGAAEPVREIFGAQYEQVESALAEMLERAGDAPAAAPAEPVASADPAG